MRFRDEEGQAVLVVALVSSVFLLGAVGLGVDGAHIYAQRQMAQAAADSAAIAGITSIYNGTNTTGSTAFSTGSSFTCSTTATSTPCVYARNNGFGGTAADTVTISFPTTATGVTLSPDFPVNLVKATITRNVNTTLLRMLGTNVSSVTATATAAIVYLVAPVPILVTHPTLASSFFMNGTPNVRICGGPRRSIQINSNASTASGVSGSGGSAVVDLSKAGPADTSGNCTTGTGADFGARGGPTSTYPPLVGHLGTTGHYVQPDDLMPDPLAGVPTPPLPTNTGLMGTHAALANGTSGCPASPQKPCQLYYPGLYVGTSTTPAIDGKGSTPVFVPGIYYLQSVYASQPSKGFAIDCSSLCDMNMATGFTDTYTGTGWTGNVMFYNIGLPADPTNAGRINISANGGSSLVGSPPDSSYKGILLFQDRNTVAQGHTLGGGGALTLQGTIYLTNTIAGMGTTPTKYQSLTLQGGAGSGTTIQGEIIVSSLSLGGNGAITMNLNSNATLVISQIALVN